MLDDKDISELATTIAKKINEPDRLWTAEDCAELFRVKPTSFLQYIAVKPGFPVPVTRKPKTWWPDEVREWARANRAA